MTDLAVVAVAIALDAAARPEIQARMRALAEAGETGTSAGRALLLSQALACLLDHERAFTHAFVDVSPPLSLDRARPHFVEATTRARSRFAVEVIRNADGTTTTREAPPMPPSDVPGVVLVTVAVARRRPLSADPQPLDRPALRACLEDLAGTTASELVAMEVIWSPAEDADRVSIADLERRHPEVRPL